MIGLRYFCREDAGTVQRALYPDMTLDAVEQMISDWNTCVFRGRRFEMLAIAAEGEIIGYASLREHSKDAVSFGIEIFPGERGKGYASEAMRLLSEKTAEDGYRLVMDQVRKDNRASIRLHEKHGFTTDGCIYRNKRDHEVIYYLKLL